MPGPSKVAVAVCAIAAAGACSSSPDELKFETASLDRGRIVSRVTATGTLSALVTVQVGSQVSGRISQLFVDFNSPVKKGQVIAKIDPQLFEAAMEQGRANAIAAQGEVAKARVQAVQAEQQLLRTRSLFEQKLIAQADLDSAIASAGALRAGVDVAEGRLSQAKASLSQAKLNLDLTSILSPINGVVISRNVDVGQTVAASFTAPTLFVIAEDLSKMQVDTSVSESDVGKLQPGMATSFLVDAFPSERFRGTVRQIRNAPQTVQNVVTYDAVIDVPNGELKLRPGMTANVTFISAERDDVLRIPNAALRFRPPEELTSKVKGSRRGGRDGGQLRAKRGDGDGGVGGGWGSLPEGDRRTAWVLRGGEPATVSIRIGVTDGSFTEVVDGELREGDTVITEVVGGVEKPQRPPGGGRGMGRVF